MPYIVEDRRTALEEEDREIDGGGELNYLFTKIIVEYLLTHGLNYKHINNVLGALEGCKLEFYQRVAAPYEKTKIRDNGDVYPRKLLSFI